MFNCHDLSLEVEPVTRIGFMNSNVLCHVGPGERGQSNLKLCHVFPKKGQ